jgi:NAD(P)-dependent dehydrogenase (short-subunit alcohol dehydrogenase family)
MRTVIVTGSSSGIGRTTAATLRRNGWQVYATARHLPDPHFQAGMRRQFNG